MNLFKVTQYTAPLLLHLVSESLKQRPVYLGNFGTCYAVIAGFRLCAFEERDSFEKTCGIALSYLNLVSSSFFGLLSVHQIFYSDQFDSETNLLDRISWAALGILAASNIWSAVKKQDLHTG